LLGSRAQQQCTKVTLSTATFKHPW
jgi:hypothetical protein